MIKSKDERLKLGKQWNQVVVDNDDGSCIWQWWGVTDNGGRERERERQTAKRESIDLN